MQEKEYLENRLDDQIKYYGNKASANQRLFRCWTVALYVLSALIPIATILSELNSILIRGIIALLGSGIAFITNIIGLYKFQELWIKYRMTAERLKSEKIAYETKLEPYDNPETALKILVSNCESIMSIERDDWKNAQLTKYLDKGVSSSTSS